MKPTVALVDDEQEILSIYQEVLSEIYEVSTFESSEPLLRELGQGYLPETVISDLKMPGRTGIEIAKEAKSLGLDVPFILISGYAAKSDVVSAINENLFFGYLDKPFTLKELTELVEGAIQHGRARTSARKRFEELRQYLDLCVDLERSQFQRAVLAENLILDNVPELFEDPAFRREYVRILGSQGEVERRIAKLGNGMKTLSSSGTPLRPTKRSTGS